MRNLPADKVGMQNKSTNKKKSKIDLFVSNKVKERRLVVKISQADLAYELGVTKGFIGRVESVSFPARYNMQHVNELAKILECSPQDFLPKTPI